MMILPFQFKRKKTKLTPQTCRNVFHVVSICCELVLEFCFLELELNWTEPAAPSVWAGQLKVQGQDKCGSCHVTGQTHDSTRQQPSPASPPPDPTASVSAAATQIWIFTPIPSWQRRSLYSAQKVTNTPRHCWTLSHCLYFRVSPGRPRRRANERTDAVITAVWVSVGQQTAGTPGSLRTETGGEPQRNQPLLDLTHPAAQAALRWCDRRIHAPEVKKGQDAGRFRD